MSKSVALIGVKSSEGRGQRQVESAVPSGVKASEVQLEKDRFKLGSLDTLLQGLERLARCETQAENFLKRIEKTYTELAPAKSLFAFGIEAKDKGQVPLAKYLQSFSWDDIRYPRSAALPDQIRNVEEKLESMDKNLRLKLQNYQESRVQMNVTAERKDTLNNFLNGNLDETIYDLVNKKVIKNPENIFVKKNYLQSLIVYVPKNSLEDFKARYEFEGEYVVPYSFSKLTEQFDYVMVHLVCYKRGIEDTKTTYKSAFGALVRDYEVNLPSARLKEEDRKKSVEQNKTDKGQLEVTCIEAFKELIVMLTHVKVYKVVVDSSLRFGSFSNFSVVMLLFDRGKEARIIQDLIAAFAEKDKLEYYGTKEQLNDVEDFFPFVYATFSITV